MKQLLVFLPLFAFLTGCLVEEKQELPRVNEYEMGKKSYTREDYSNAVQYQTQWIQKYPKDSAAYIERGRAYDKMGQYEDALVDYSQALELDPKSARPLVYKAGALQALGRTKEAQSTLGLAANHPGFNSLNAYEKFLAYWLDGEFSLLAGDNEAAIESLDKALEIYDTNTVIFLNYKSRDINRLPLRLRAVAASRLGDFEQAVDDMEGYVVLSEKNGHTVTSKDYLKLASYYYTTDQYEKSQSVLKKMSPEDQRAFIEVFGE